MCIRDSFLNSDAFQNALARAREQIIADWEHCEAQDERERLWYEQQALDRIVDRLRIAEDRGEYAEMRSPVE